MNDHDDPDFVRPTDDTSPSVPMDLSAEAAPDDAASDVRSDDEQVLPVDIGRALPPAARQVPLLSPAGVHPTAAGDSARSGSTIAEGIHFAGNATLRGACSVAGSVDGHLRQADGAFVAVVVTETGRVKGDISAQRISVMGQTEGVLDAGTGEVSLHDGSNVQGTVRYGRIQVNGANLNATLERVASTQG